MASDLFIKAREKGLRDSASFGLNLLQRQAMSWRRADGQQYVFVAPHVDNTGAPAVLVRVIEEFDAEHEGRTMRLLTPYVWPDQRKRLTSTRVRIERAASVLGPRLVRLQLGLRESDFVLMNSAAAPKNYRDSIVEALGSGRLALANWLIHEDAAQLGIVAPDVLDPGYRRRLAELIEQDRLRVFVPSQSIKASYDALLGTGKVRLLALQVDLGGLEQPTPNADDYRRIDFLLTGTAADGRKGQLVALFAFQQFIERFHRHDPHAYRDFGVNFVGIGDDYVSRQCRAIGSSVLGERFRAYRQMSRGEALRIAQGCNAVICCSMNEAFPLYIAEGMAFGHVLLRNRVGGFEEQLAEGVNGFEIDGEDIVQFGGVIEKILNRATLTDSRLAEMGRASQAMIAPYLESSYTASLEGIRE